MGFDISLSTVYRNLHRLRAVGNVMTVGGERGLRYETAQEVHEHDHLICLSCGLTIEFQDELIRVFGKTVAQRQGYNHHSSRFDILGYCSDCSLKNDAHSIDQTASALKHCLDSLAEAATLTKQAAELNDHRRFTKAIKSADASMEKLQQATESCQKALALLSRHTSAHDL